MYPEESLGPGLTRGGVPPRPEPGLSLADGSRFILGRVRSNRIGFQAQAKNAFPASGSYLPVGWEFCGIYLVQAHDSLNTETSMTTRNGHGRRAKLAGDLSRPVLARNMRNLVLVRYIPATFQVVDLRTFFSTFVETGRFVMFHFKRRPDAVAPPQHPDDSVDKSGSVASSGSVSQVAIRTVEAERTRWCCLTQLKDQNGVKDFMDMYNNKPWTDRHGESAPGKCVLEIPAVEEVASALPGSMADRVAAAAAPAPSVASSSSSSATTAVRDVGPLGPRKTFLTRRQRREKAERVRVKRQRHVAKEVDVDSLRRAELFAPVGLPQGNVGTPEVVILNNSHRLPPGMLSKLGVRTFRTDNNVAFDYTVPARRKKGKASSDRFRMSKADRKAELRYLLEEVNFPGDDERKLRAMTLHKDEQAEEWDRHMANNPVMDNGRLLRKIGDQPLYEHEVRNPWDKGDASGLVWYTDEQYWEANKGGFDEQTVDDWDVDTHHRDRADVLSVKPKRRVRARKKTVMPPPVGRAAPARAPADCSGSASASGSGAAGTSRFGARIMQKQGWVTGKGIGKRNQGIAHALEPSGNPLKQGLGFVQRPDLAKRNKRQSQRANDAKNGKRSSHGQGKKRSKKHKLAADVDAEYPYGRPGKQGGPVGVDPDDIAEELDPFDPLGFNWADVDETGNSSRSKLGDLPAQPEPGLGSIYDRPETHPLKTSWFPEKERKQRLGTFTLEEAEAARVIQSAAEPPGLPDEY